MSFVTTFWTCLFLPPQAFNYINVSTMKAYPDCFRYFKRKQKLGTQLRQFVYETDLELC